LSLKTAIFACCEANKKNKLLLTRTLRGGTNLAWEPTPGGRIFTFHPVKELRANSHLNAGEEGREESLENFGA